MGIRFFRPLTPGTRNCSVSDFQELTSGTPEKSLVVARHRAVGRNNRGVITSRHRGGGHKRLYRIVDFKRSKLGIPGKVVAVHYDPNRNARLALLHYQNGEKAYILYPRGLRLGATLLADVNAPPVIGNALPLQNMPLGAEMHNVEVTPGMGGQLVRAAGTVAQLVAKEGIYATLRLPSGEVRLVLQSCWATLGQVGNVDAINLTKGKAGRNRWLGKRPHVRGSAMNPCDHPHGGGEGRAPIGRTRPVTPWGKPALGQRTRTTNRPSSKLLVRRRK